jgi:prepilin-type N-terminal cleavage/methylation domain-containing protein
VIAPRPKAPRHTQKRGFTLPEILTVAALFLLLLTAATTTLLACVRAYHKGDEKAPALRANIMALQEMAEALRTCERIYAPSEEELKTGYSPCRGVAPLVILCAAGEEQAPEVLAYVLDKKSRRLEEILYDPLFDPLDSARQGITRKRLVSMNTQDLTFRHERRLFDEFLTIELQPLDPGRSPDYPSSLRPAEPPLQTKVKLKRGYR